MASLSRSLWHRNRVLAEAALEHLFVQGIASGELARATFAHYVGQDAVFLDAFCRAYDLGLAKSPDPEGVIAFRELLDAAADELRLHNGYAARWGVDLHQAADPATSVVEDRRRAGRVALLSNDPRSRSSAGIDPRGGSRASAPAARQVSANSAAGDGQPALRANRRSAEARTERADTQPGSRQALQRQGAGTVRGRALCASYTLATDNVVWTPASGLDDYPGGPRQVADDPLGAAATGP